MHRTPFIPATRFVPLGFKRCTSKHLFYVIKLRTLKGAEEDQDWKDDESRMGRLRQRRGRTIVHRSLEDNYGAVVVANHEALAQFLEQVCIRAAIVAQINLKRINLEFSVYVKNHRFFAQRSFIILDF